MMRIPFLILTIAAVIGTAVAAPTDLRKKTNAELLAMQRQELAAATAAKEAAQKAVKVEADKAAAYKRWAENESLARVKAEKDYKPLQHRAFWRKFWLAVVAPCFVWILTYVWACEHWRSVRSPGWICTSIGGLIFILILFLA